jgi:hypothetical protein
MHQNPTTREAEAGGLGVWGQWDPDSKKKKKRNQDLSTVCALDQLGGVIASRLTQLMELRYAHIAMYTKSWHLMFNGQRQKGFLIDRPKQKNCIIG